MLAYLTSTSAAFEPCAAYLRLAVFCSHFGMVEAVFGDGTWRLRSLAAAARLLILPALSAMTFAVRFAWLPVWIPVSVAIGGQCMLRLLLRLMPGSFTAGEAMALSAGIVLLFLDTSALVARDVLGAF